MDEIDALLYMPGSFVCHKCGFELTKQTISVATGQIGIRRGWEDPEPCPNDGEMLRRKTWKEAFQVCAEQSHELAIALIESVELQSHYAKILNGYDGGERRQFSTFGEWIDRLREVGKIERRA